MSNAAIEFALSECKGIECPLCSGANTTVFSLHDAVCHFRITCLDCGKSWEILLPKGAKNPRDLVRGFLGRIVDLSRDLFNA